MRKLVHGLTAATLAFGASSCTSPESRSSRAPASSTASEGLPIPSLASECDLHTYILDAAPGANKEQACKVAKRVGSAILNNQPVSVAHRFTYYDRINSPPTCIIQPIIAEDNGQGYLLSVSADAGVPRMTVYGLPEDQHKDFTIQQEDVHLGEGGYVSDLDGVPVGQSRTEITVRKDGRDNYVCHDEFFPR